MLNGNIKGSRIIKEWAAPLQNTETGIKLRPGNPPEKLQNLSFRPSNPHTYS